MKRALQRCSLLGLCLLFTLSIRLNAQTYPVVVSILPNLSISVNIDDYLKYENQQILTLLNTGSTSLDLTLYGLFKADNGVQITFDESNKPLTPITLAPGESRSFSPLELGELYPGLGVENIEMSSLTEDLLAQVMINRSIPEGAYQLCVRAYDYYTGIPLSGEDPQGCSQEISISYMDPPIIISPEAEENIPSSNVQLIPITWTDASLSLNRVYKLEMIDLSDIGNLNVYQAFETENIPRFFEKDNISVTSYGYSFSDPALIPGNTYAIRVTASDPTGETLYRQDGKSDIVTFSYGGCNGAQTHIILTEEYPLHGDTLPFTGMNLLEGGHVPLLIKFSPFCNFYRGCHGDLTINGKNVPPYVRPWENRWGQLGPLGYLNRQLQQNGWPAATEEEAQILPMDVRARRISENFSYKPGETYTWSVEAQMRVGQTNIPINLYNREVTLGMTRPIPGSPENGATVDPGNIELIWEGGRKPQKILPDHLRNHRMDGNQILDRQETAAAWARGQLQVSKDPDFANILLKHSFELGGTEYKYPTMSGEDILDEMYGERKHTLHISDPDTYYWRVVYLTDPGDANSAPYLKGPKRSFVIEKDEPEDPCKSTCDAASVENRQPIDQLNTGQFIQIGKFALELTEVTEDGDTYSGKGLIPIPWLNHCKLMVTFDNLKVNTDLVVSEGEAHGVTERIPFTLENVVGPAGNILAPALGDKGKMNEYLEEGRAVTDLLRSQTITLPIGIDKTIEGHKFIIGIVGMTFTPSGAKLNAAAEIDFKADWNIYTPGFGAEDVCFHPYGLEDVATLYLKKSFYLMPVNWKLYFELLGADKAANEQQITKLEWDCDGYKCLQINGQVIFDRKIMIPADQQGNPTQGQVKARIRGQQCRGNNWMFDVDMQPFQIPGAPGFTFTAQEASLDLSDLENPFNMAFPDNYETSIDLEDPDQANTWKGFYLKTLQMQAPSDFMMGANASAGVYGMIIDKSGFTADFRVQNLVPLDKGNFNGWGISIDIFEVSILQNRFVHGRLNGKVDLPISKDGDVIDYSALLSNNNRRLGFTSRIQPRDEISVDLMAASLKIDPNSYIDIKIGAQVGQQTRTDYAELNLQGSVTISDENVRDAVKLASNFVPSLAMSGLHGHLTYSTDQGFTRANLSKASPQKFLAGFPLTIQSINLRHNAQEVRLEIEPLISLTGGNTAISARTRISLNSELNLLGSNNREKFVLKGISFDGIWIDATIAEFGLKGSLEFYKEGSKEGAKGNLEVALPLDLGLQTNVEFGVYRKNKTARYNTPDYFSYWYVDGMVSIPYGIPIANGYAIYAFGGGAYHHMRVNPNSLPSPEKAFKCSGRSESPVSSGAKYVPDFNTSFGFNVAAVTGSHPDPNTLNIKGKISAEFNRRGGLNRLIVEGDLSLMSDPAGGKSNKSLWGNAIIVYRKIGSKHQLDGNLDLYFDAKNIQGSGPNKLMINAVFHAGPDKWFFHAGNYWHRGGLRVKYPYRISIQSYLMIGHDIPDYLPPPSGFLKELFDHPKVKSGKGKVSFENTSSSANRAPYDQTILQSGQGLAFGLAFEAKMGVDIKVIKAHLTGIVGGDVKVVKSSQCKGINGWQGAGQAYAGLHGGFYVDIPAIGKHKIVDLKAGTLLVGNAPNPIGFEGRAKVKVTFLFFSERIGFKVRVGKLCGI